MSAKKKKNVNKEEPRTKKNHFFFKSFALGWFCLCPTTEMVFTTITTLSLRQYPKDPSNLRKTISGSRSRAPISLILRHSTTSWRGGSQRTRLLQSLSLIQRITLIWGFWRIFARLSWHRSSRSQSQRRSFSSLSYRLMQQKSLSERWEKEFQWIENERFLFFFHAVCRSYFFFYLYNDSLYHNLIDLV